MLEFNVRHQRLTRIDVFDPAEKSVGYLHAKINFLTDEWKNADTVKLRAKNQADIVVHEADVVDGMATVPWEALDGGGSFSVSLFARDGDVEITTGTVTISLLHTLDSGLETNPPTPTEFDKLRQDVEDLKEQVENLEPGNGNGTAFKTDETLSLKNGILSVNTTDVVAQDNTLPITSAGVFATVGNIEALLKTI